MSQVGRPHTPYDWSAGVRVRVQRACQAPYFSVFREENTRQADAVYEGRLGRAGAGAYPAIQDDGLRLLYFPYRNAAPVHCTTAEAAGVASETVTLVGATGTMGKFVAEQYLRRGVSVTVLARDIEKAKSLFLPIADGQREKKRLASMGYRQLGGAAEKRELAGSLHYRDSRREGRHVLRYEFRNLRSVGGPSASSANVSCDQRVALELIEGDVGSTQDLEFSMRHSSVVFYLAAALEEASGPGLRAGDCLSSSAAWWSPGSWFGSGRRFGGFLHALDACRRVDAHFVALTPLWVHGSCLSPLYWYRRLLSYPRGYCKAVQLQEQTLLSQSGSPGARCSLGADELEERQPGGDWGFWWRSRFSTELLADIPIQLRSPVRFSLFRLSDVVFPSFNERIVASKNNRIDDDLHVKSIQQGDLDARLLANVLVKSIGLCNSVVESRIDMGGRLRGGTDMRDANAIFDLFEQLRNE
ncbi:conserved hypothetical protein [Leishmania mexicana MHOM/GT/2001/U1103]|uniref:Uncharacterized protein n=1 Tax=Leishmania mexicana (strain MHOM/GT/2001/U1103) TaxID=929439 RepID=E9B4P6_LEIMU|nr:conserved hypothetical protein [Leishmania mexicana MHOM/GT/2001/U1103]CBZ30215.1 conserved hypothetical protein [Leishmania mexicana MHOM/GT/2001/U1103]